MENNINKNIALIDGQNLHMATAKRVNDPWHIDLVRFRIYLEQKYHVTQAYYFLGYVQETNQDLYEEIQKAGYVLLFREHNPAMLGTKKGNVDSDIIFHIMKKLYKKEDFEKVILVSGDGDYKRMVDFLIEENRFEKILLPDRNRASSLYKRLGAHYFAALDTPGVRLKIEKKKAP
ncbi:MAG TPA: NYN domain-containing protein [Candidatus Paceibacterota bacterium]|nr:NYN domain-containing protein [Candidatus Paceibacterota bacterium]